MANRLEGRYQLPARRSSVRMAFLFVSESPAGRQVPFHSHEALELVYYVEGEGRSALEQDPQRIVRNSFTITPSGVHHDQLSKTDLTSVCLGLVGSGLEDVRGVWHDREGGLRRLIEQLLQEVRQHDAEFETVCEGLVLAIVGLARRIAATKPGKSSKEAVVARALDLIRTEDGALSVQELSARLYVSRDYLRHLFQEHTNASPLRHLINARIERAKDLLGRSDLGIGEIARQSGFENSYYFSRLFKQVTGQTPSAFRRALASQGTP